MLSAMHVMHASEKDAQKNPAENRATNRRNALPSLEFEDDTKRAFAELERRDTPNPWVELQPTCTPPRSISPNAPATPLALAHPHSPLSPDIDYDLEYPRDRESRIKSYGTSKKPKRSETYPYIKNSQNKKECCGGTCCEGICKLLELIGRLFTSGVPC